MKSFTKHPRYDNQARPTYDIAVIKLTTKVGRFTKFIQPLCLLHNMKHHNHGSQGLSTSLSHLESGNQTLQVAGWGDDGRSGVGTVLRYAHRMRYVENNQCNREWGYFGRPGILESQVCARGDNWSSACHGDSGGPLMWNLGGREFLLGVVSWGPPTCATGRTTQPAIHTNLADIGSFTPFLKQNIGGDP